MRAPSMFVSFSTLEPLGPLVALQGSAPANALQRKRCSFPWLMLKGVMSHVNNSPCPSQHRNHGSTQGYSHNVRLFGAVDKEAGHDGCCGRAMQVLSELVS